MALIGPLPVESPGVRLIDASDIAQIVTFLKAGVFPNVTAATGGYVYETAADPVAAAGSTQAAATVLTAQISRIATATAGSAFGIALPLASPGLELALINDTAVPVTVYAQNGSADNINDTLGSTGVVQMPNSMVIYAATAAGKWYAEGLGTGFAPSGVNIETASYTDAITAAGTNAATGTALTTQINRITTNTGAGGVGVTLPLAKPGLSIQVSNATAATLTIYGNGADDIQVGGAAAAASITATTLKTGSLWCASTGHWHGIVA
jgi:hypothetical protein